MPTSINTATNEGTYSQTIDFGLMSPHTTSPYFSGGADNYGIGSVYYKYGYIRGEYFNIYLNYKDSSSEPIVKDNSIVTITFNCDKGSSIVAGKPSKNIAFATGTWTYTSVPIPDGFYYNHPWLSAHKDSKLVFNDLS